MDKNLIKIRNMLKPIVKDLVKEVLFSEEGVLSGIIQECVKGLGRDVIIEQNKDLNLRKNKKEEENHKREVNQKIERMKEERNKRIGLMKNSGFSKVFEGLDPISDSGTTSELNSSLQRASLGNMPNPSDKGVNIEGIISVSSGKWKNLVK